MGIPRETARDTICCIWIILLERKKHLHEALDKSTKAWIDVKGELSIEGIFVKNINISNSSAAEH